MVLDSSFLIELGCSLSQGQPAKARVQSPTDSHVPNPKRPSNPFTPSPEPDWVDVKKRSSNGRPEPPPSRGSQRARAGMYHGTGSTPGSTSSSPPARPPGTQNSIARKMIVPPSSSGQSNPAQALDATCEPLGDHLLRNASNASSQSFQTLPYRAANVLVPTPQQPLSLKKPPVLRKPGAPPIPNKKPFLLSRAVSPVPTSAPGGLSSAPPSAQRYRDELPVEQAQLHSQSPSIVAQRSIATPLTLGKPAPEPNGKAEIKPVLPPRSGTGFRVAKTWSEDGRDGRDRNFLDEEPEDCSNMREWEVLKPER